jgi:hypothetical protein
MSHFAKIDSNNIVTDVITAEKSVVDTFIDASSWIQTSYTARIRGKYAGIGDTYDPIKDVFIAPYVPPTIPLMNVSSNGTS